MTDPSAIDAGGVKVAIVAARFNDFVTDKLVEGALECLERHGGAEADRQVLRVPGAWEVPLAVDRIAPHVDAVVAIGALIRGETTHYDYICEEVARGLGAAARAHGVPVTFGVLTCENAEQAIARAGGDQGNKGYESALAALEMVQLYRSLPRG